MRLRTYIVLWLSAGALEGLTIVGAWACLGLLIGLAVAGAGLLLPALVVFLYFAINLLLSRLVYVWLGRLLAKRRTREIVLIVCSLIGLLPRMLQTMRADAVRLLHRLPIPPKLYSVLHWMPPYLAAHTLLRGSDAPVRAAGLLLWTLGAGDGADAGPAPHVSRRTGAGSLPPHPRPGARRSAATGPKRVSGLRTAVGPGGPRC